MACPPALAYADGPVAWVLMVVVGGLVVGVAVVGVVVVTIASAPGQPVRSHRPRQALKNGHAIPLSSRNVYVAMLFKLLSWTGWPVPFSLCVSDQPGKI